MNKKAVEKLSVILLFTLISLTSLVFAITYSDVSTNGTYINKSTNFTIFINDTTALEPNGYYIFSTNNSGVWVNETSINFTSTPQQVSTIKILNSTLNTVVGYMWYIFDNVGNAVSTTIYTLTTTSYPIYSLTNTTSETTASNFTHLNISTVPPYNSLVAYYPFDGDAPVTGTTCYDWGPNHLNGIYTGNTKSNSTSGLYGNGSYFGGGTSDYIYNSSSKLNMDGYNWSVSVWIKTTGVQPNSYLNETYGGIATKGILASLTGWGMYLDNEAPAFQIKHSSTGAYITSPDKVNDSNWHNIVVTVNRNSTTGMNLYVDNILKNTTDPTPVKNFDESNSYKFAIGAVDSGSINYRFKGTIDEVMIFNTTLNSTQVSDIYNNHSPRFVNSGRYDYLNQSLLSITPGKNVINISTAFQNLLNSSINLTVSYYNGTWYPSDSKTISNNQYTAYNISDAAYQLIFNYTLIPSNYSFYSPLFLGNEQMVLGARPLTLSITNPINNGQIDTRYVDLQYSYDGAGIDKCWYSLNGGVTNSTPSQCTGVFQSLTPNQGSNTWTVYINETGNSTTATTTFNVISMDYCSNPIHPGYKLVFNDEFNGNTLNTTKWGQEYAWGVRWLSGNSEQEYYQDGDRYHNVSNGILYLTAYNESTGGQPYTSGMISGDPTFSQQYGLFEASMITPYGNGTWPAFWTLPSDLSWPPEIDVMEQWGDNNNRVQMTYHWNDSGVNRQQAASYTGNDPGASYHTYSADWEAGNITMYIDGTQRYQYINSTTVTNKTMYPIIDLALGGAGGTVQNITWPISIGVDYVRVWQKCPGAYPFSNIVTTPDNNTQYSPNQNYQFNVTIQDSNGTAGMEFNGVNYSLSNISTSFYTTLTDLPAGNYNYYFWSYGNGAKYSFNKTDTYEYTIAQSQTALYLTGTNPINYLTATDVSGTNCPVQLTCILNQSNQVYGAGTQIFNYSTSGNTNYTSNWSTLAITINQIAGNITLLLNNTNGDINITTNSQVNASALSPTGQIIQLLRNGADVTNQNNIFQSLGVGYYNYTAIALNNQNYTSATVTHFVNVTIAPDITPPQFSYIPPSTTITYKKETLGINFTATDNVALGTYFINDTKFLINSTGWLTNATILAAGTYSINVSVNDSSNNINSTTYLVIVSKATPALTLSGTTPITYPTTTDVAGSNCPSEVTCSLNQTNQIYPVGTQIFNYSTSGNANYTSNWSTLAITTNANSSSCAVYFNATSPQTWPAKFIAYTNCTSAYNFYRNGTSITNASTQSLAVGTWNFTISRTDIQNYSIFYDTKLFIINSGCTENLTNTSWSLWVNLTGCQINDTTEQIRNSTQYDSNQCGYTANQTIYDYQEISCNYCSYSLTNTSWSDWMNISCLPIDLMEQEISLTQYDQNYSTCCAVTNLSSDCYANQTFHQYQNNLSCVYIPQQPVEITGGSGGGGCPVCIPIENQTITDILNKFVNQSKFKTKNLSDDISNTISDYYSKSKDFTSKYYWAIIPVLFWIIILIMPKKKLKDKFKKIRFRK